MPPSIFSASWRTLTTKAASWTCAQCTKSIERPITTNVFHKAPTKKFFSNTPLRKQSQGQFTRPNYRTQYKQNNRDLGYYALRLLVLSLLPLQPANQSCLQSRNRNPYSRIRLRPTLPCNLPAHRLRWHPDYRRHTVHTGQADSG